MSLDTTTRVFGLHTFGDVTPDADGRPLPHAQVLRNIVEEAVLADTVGVDFFGVGEHHREDYAISAPEVLLANIAARTKRIRLGTAVTVLSSDDPIRVYQRFSTLHALSQGRAEVLLGRGSFIESFPLFGYDLNDYELLFDEKLELFRALLEEKPVTWSGKTRPPLNAQHVFPPLEHGRLDAWIGSGGNPESVVRAAKSGLPIMFAIIGGRPKAFAPLAELYHTSVEQFGGDPRIAAHSPGYITETDEAARDEAWPHYAAMHDRIGRERGWRKVTRDDFERESGPDGSLFIGSPETVAVKVAKVCLDLRLTRFDLKYSLGTLPHERLMESIRLYGTEVLPRVRAILDW